MDPGCSLSLKITIENSKILPTTIFAQFSMDPMRFARITLGESVINAFSRKEFRSGSPVPIFPTRSLNMLAKRDANAIHISPQNRKRLMPLAVKFRGCVSFHRPARCETDLIKHFILTVTARTLPSILPCTGTLNRDYHTNR